MTSNSSPLTLLCILDGLGLNPESKGNAFKLARTPILDDLMSSSPWTSLRTDGELVGLPNGQMGNSEVGHLNIGAGRTVEQSLLSISKKLAGDYLSKSQEFNKLIGAIKGHDLHLIGLFSDGGVHSHSEHLTLLLKHLLSEKSAFKGEIFLHLITDGRDSSPHAALSQLSELEYVISASPRCTISTVIGRFYAMDRDKRWERTKKAYELYMNATGESHGSVREALKAYYESNSTDEFIEPTVINPKPIAAADGLIFWNFRADRMRQIISSLFFEDFDGFERKGKCVSTGILPKDHGLCFSSYDQRFDLPVLFSKEPINNHLGEVIASHGKRQFRIAETEKYPHVTYFFNGGNEHTLPGEEREMIPSPREVKTYDLKPEMSAFEVTEALIKAISSGKYDFILVNFANCDMVGHTGNLDAAIKAVETVDNCLGKVLLALKKASGQALIIADHGNAEQMINYEDGSPHTAHTTFPVPAIFFNCDWPMDSVDDAALKDIAPTILKMMNIQMPEEMSGRSLLKSRAG